VCVTFLRATPERRGLGFQRRSGVQLTALAPHVGDMVEADGEVAQCLRAVAVAVEQPSREGTRWSSTSA
jgi:hypothetical protein